MIVSFESFAVRDGPRVRAGVVAAHLCAARRGVRVETGELLGIDESTVRTHLRRGLAHLRSALEVSTDVH